MAWGAEDYLHAGELARAIANLRGNTDGFGHFGTKIGVEMRFEKKQPVRTCRLFSQIYTKKSQLWAFGTDLERIWPFQIFGCLGVWANNELWQAPVRLFGWLRTRYLLYAKGCILQ